MVELLNINGPGLGIEFAPVVVRATCRIAAGSSVGDIVQFDTLLSDGAVNDNDQGTSDSGLSNFIVPTTAGLPDSFFGVVLEAVADNNIAQVLVQGRVAAQTTGTPAVGVSLVAADAASTLAATGGAGGEKILGYAIVTGTSTPTDVVFDGINGLGGKDTA